jgi:hypothetical protein
MHISRKPWLVSLRLGVMITCLFLATISSSSAASVNSSQSLAEEVNNLAQECQNADSLTAKQLQDVITRCDVLSETVIQSNHIQKKLLVIRLKKSRNLCLFLLQLQQRE